MKFKTGMVITLLMLFGLQELGYTEVITPKVVPAGWIYDYDYEEDIMSYLYKQYLYARMKNRTPYIYIYKDGDAHCRYLRNLMEQEEIRDVFKGTEIILLQLRALKILYKEDPNSNIKPPTWIPAMAKIGERGIVTESIVNPDVYLFHPEVLRRTNASIISKKGTPSKKDYIRYMKKYFEENNNN